MSDVRLDETALARLRDELTRHRDFLRAEVTAQGAEVIAVVRAGQRISLERLEALPWAELGIDCKQRTETR
jgi:hypothetical protein